MSDVVSGNPSPEMLDRVFDLAADANAELLPELADWVEEGQWGPMLRHPLVYMVPLSLPGMANKALLAKQEAVRTAIEEEDWHSVVFLHERPYRLTALLSVVGTDEFGETLPLRLSPEHWELAASVWVDSENIQQHTEQWRALIDNGEGLWLGSPEERIEFEQLPRFMVEGQECVHAWRGGAVGDWSWTTDRKIAEFFARRSGCHVRGFRIPVSDVFGYLTQRGEAELMVKFTEFRRSLVYPNGEFPETEED